MGTITSGVGLISGLDYQELISKLIELESGPRDMLINRASEIDAQRTAFLDISARLSGMLSKVLSLKKSAFFTANTVSSSDTNILSASAGATTPVGSYQFIVKSLAATHQLVSRGFTTRDAQMQAGELLIESARARVNSDTKLDELNGYQGVSRGSFDLTDNAGHTARINISSASTLAEVVDQINAADVDVTAAIQNDQLLLTENNGGTLRVREVNGGTTAADLGFTAGHTYTTDGRLEGAALVYLTNNTPLSALNDANGVSYKQALSDFQINDFKVKLSDILDPETNLHVLNRGRGVDLGVVRVTIADENGVEQQYEVDLRGLQTAGDVKNALEGGVEGVMVTLADNRLRIGFDTSASDRTIKVEDVSGHAARDLGIEQTTAAESVNGKGVLYMDTLGAVMAAINYADGNDGSVTAAIDGTRLTLSGAGDLELSTVNNSNALSDLGFSAGTYSGSVSGQRIIGGLDSALLTSLNGGQGFQPGRVNFQVGGAEMTLDLTGTETLQEVVDRINEAAQVEDMGFEVGYDHTGTRLIFESIDGTTPITITDVEGTFASDLGLNQAEPGARIRSNNLQKQYVSGAQRLEDLNNGRGTTLGSIQIKNSQGLTVSIDLSGNNNIRTLQDVIDRINEATLPSGAGLAVTARINDQGDGIVLEDAAGGELALEVSDLSGTVARDLNIAGTSNDGVIDGSREISLQIEEGDTLDDLVERINAHGSLVSAGVLNDGTGVSPYRLQLTSANTGLGGELLVDGLGFVTMTNAQDARIILGSNPDSGILITSGTNTISDVVPGMTLNLTAASDDVVTVGVNRDLDSIVTAFSDIVDNYNSALERIGELTSYDAENETAGILLGDNTLLTIQSRMSQMIMMQRSEPVGTLRRLSDFGIRFRDGQLELDEDKLRTVLKEKPDDVIEFFTDEEKGLASVLEDKLEAITDTGGLIDRHDDLLEAKKKELTDRIDTLNDRLDRRSEQLLNQFLAMESALAQMQSQQTVLSQLAALSGTTSSTTTTSS